jgi:hypothetical protein
LRAGLGPHPPPGHRQQLAAGRYCRIFCQNSQPFGGRVRPKGRPTGTTATGIQGRYFQQLPRRSFPPSLFQALPNGSPTKHHRHSKDDVSFPKQLNKALIDIFWWPWSITWLWFSSKFAIFVPQPTSYHEKTPPLFTGLHLLPFFLGLNLWAQPPTPPDEPAIPIDDGWWVLALAGVGYGVRFYLKRKKGQ